MKQFQQWWQARERRKEGIVQTCDDEIVLIILTLTLILMIRYCKLVWSRFESYKERERETTHGFAFCVVHSFGISQTGLYYPPPPTHSKTDLGAALQERNFVNLPPFSLLLSILSFVAVCVLSESRGVWVITFDLNTGGWYSNLKFNHGDGTFYISNNCHAHKKWLSCASPSLLMSSDMLCGTSLWHPRGFPFLAPHLFLSTTSSSVKVFPLQQPFVQPHCLSFDCWVSPMQARILWHNWWRCCPLGTSCGRRAIWHALSLCWHCQISTHGRHVLHSGASTNSLRGR